ncbi:MAG: DNA-deoxyinosine glycosylase [Bacillota bacterium]|nr:DNA-deoxyinosine glycosylase [Bacillota bacterium]
MLDYIKSFDPLIDNESEVLILGSIPGVKSLEMNQYYAKSTNSFWKILFELFDEPFSIDYEKRKTLIKNQKIALWDVLHQYRREGSLDSDIKNEEINDFDWCFEQFKNIKYVFFNGKKSYDSFAEKYGFLGLSYIEFMRLPSTSAAYTIKYEDKLDSWKVIKQKLDKRVK